MFRRTGNFSGEALMIAPAIDTLPEIARAIVSRTAARHGTPHDLARRVVARRAGTTPAALEHIERGRAKRIPVHVASILLGEEIAALEARLAELRAIAAHPLSPDFQRAEAALVEARKAMGMT